MATSVFVSNYMCLVVNHFRESLGHCCCCFLGCSSAECDVAAADISQPTDDAYATDDDRAARYGDSGTAGHGAHTTAADPSQPCSNDAAGPRSRRQCGHPESAKLDGCSPVTFGHLHRTDGVECAWSTTRCHAAGFATATAENHLVWLVLLVCLATCPLTYLRNQRAKCRQTFCAC